MNKLIIAAALLAAFVSCTDYSYDLMRIDPDMKVLPGVQSDINETFTAGGAEINDVFCGNETVANGTVDFSQVGPDLGRWKLDYVHVEEIQIGFRASNPFPVSLAAESADNSLYTLETVTIEPGTPETPAVTEGVMTLSSQQDLLRMNGLPVRYTLTRYSAFGTESEAKLAITFTWISFPGGVGVNFLQ